MKLSRPDKENHDNILELLNNLKKEMSSITLKYLEDFIGRCEQEDIMNLKMKAESIDSNLSDVRISPLKNKFPPHYRISW